MAGRGGGGAGLLHTDLVGAVLHRLRRLRLGLGETLARAGDGVLLRQRRSLGLGDGGLRGRGGGHGSVVLLLGDHVLLDQRGVAIDVRLRLERVGLGLGDARVGGLHLLLRLRNHIGCPLHIAGGGADHGADRDLRDGHIDRGLGVLCLRAGQVGLRLVERDLVVGGVDLGQQLAGLHGLVVVHGDLHHLARDARADLVEVAVHLRVVGVFDEGGAPVEEGRAQHEQQHNADDGELAVAVGLGGVVGLALGDGAGLGCGSGRRPACRSGSVRLPRLLPSEKIFQVGLRDAEGARQRELGGVVLVERGDVLVVGLLHRGLAPG